jgi:LmbE family N-acetylglucosaminyl deacetylase
MLKLRLGSSKPTVLCLGAHCDDIEIGCGGTLLHLRASYPDVAIHWAILSAPPDREPEARASARSFLGDGKQNSVSTRQFRDGFFPFDGAEIKLYFEELAKRFKPDLIITHDRGDLHQDHRVVGELTQQTFRDHAIIEMEIPKYDGGLTPPNLYVPLEPAHADQKIEYLLRHYASQKGKPWFREATFRGLMCVRGVECRAPSGCAEAFHARKLVLG